MTECAQKAWHGKGGVVLIGGEPGVGKTRLLSEFLERARFLGADILFGSAYESDGMPPYLPIAEALRHYLQSSSGDRLRAYLDGVGRDIGRVMPELGDLLPHSPASPGAAAIDRQLGDAEGERYRLFESVRTLLDHIAGSASNGLVLALDDLHWAGMPTLQFVLHLARRAASMPVLLVGTYRTVDLPRSHPLSGVLAELSREGLYQRLALQPLSRQETSALIENVDGVSPAQAVIDAIYRETAGNPFFTIELTRHVREQHQDLGNPPDKWGVPEGVHLVIGSRLARLSAEANLLLQSAAVLGEPFSFDVLEAMLGLEPATVLDALEDALRAGFLREDGSRYHFSHALVRQTLYHELTLPRRQRLHQQAAAAIECVLGGKVEPVLSELAVHYRLAGTAAEAEKAISYSERAGESALSLLAYEEAAEHWQAALAQMSERVSEPARLAHLLECLGSLNYLAALDCEAGIDHLQQSLQLYRDLGRDEDAARVHAQLGNAFASMPETWDIPRALDHYRAAEDILTRTTPGSALSRVYIGLAQAACWNVQVNEGLQASDKALKIAEAVQDEILWADAAMIRGGHLCSSGRVNQGFALMEQAWDAAQHIRQPMTFFNSFLASAFAHWLGDPGRAKAWCKRELAKATAGQAPDQRRRFLTRLASAEALTGNLTAGRAALNELGPSYDAWQVLFLVGDWEQCEVTAARQAEACRRGNTRAFLFEATHDLAQLEYARGHLARAISLQEEVMPIAVDGGELLYELTGRVLLGLLYAEQGDLQKAAEHVARGRDIVRAAEDCRGLVGRLLLAEAVLTTRTGDLAAGEVLFVESMEVARRYVFPWGEAEALYLWGRALRLAGETGRAADKFEASVDLYRRLGAGECWRDRVRASQGSPAVQGNEAIRPVQQPGGLSQREVTVLRLVAAGRTNLQISDELVISLNTVARHVSHIFQKTGAGNRTEAAGWAYRHELGAQPSAGRS